MAFKNKVNNLPLLNQNSRDEKFQNFNFNLNISRLKKNINTTENEFIIPKTKKKNEKEKENEIEKEKEKKTVGNNLIKSSSLTIKQNISILNNKENLAEEIIKKENLNYKKDILTYNENREKAYIETIEKKINSTINDISLLNKDELNEISKNQVNLNSKIKNNFISKNNYTKNNIANLYSNKLDEQVKNQTWNEKQMIDIKKENLNFRNNLIKLFSSNKKISINDEISKNSKSFNKFINKDLKHSTKKEDIIHPKKNHDLLFNEIIKKKVKVKDNAKTKTNLINDNIDESNTMHLNIEKKKNKKQKNPKNKGREIFYHLKDSHLNTDTTIIKEKQNIFLESHNNTRLIKQNNDKNEFTFILSNSFHCIGNLTSNNFILKNPNETYINMKIRNNSKILNPFKEVVEDLDKNLEVNSEESEYNNINSQKYCSEYFKANNIDINDTEESISENINDINNSNYKSNNNVDNVDIFNIIDDFQDSEIRKVQQKASFDKFNNNKFLNLYKSENTTFNNEVCQTKSDYSSNIYNFKNKFAAISNSDFTNCIKTFLIKRNINPYTNTVYKNFKMNNDLDTNKNYCKLFLPNKKLY